MRDDKKLWFESCRDLFVFKLKHSAFWTINSHSMDSFQLSNKFVNAISSSLLVELIDSRFFAEFLF